MKPELKALWQAILDTPTGDPNGLHWRGDELWCGPMVFGHLEQCHGFWAWHSIMRKTVYDDNNDTREKARAALEAAARDQIKTLFKE